MLFTTGMFAFLFLPITLAGFYFLSWRWRSAAAGWLFLASLLFYAYWIPQFTALLLGSICVNYFVGRRIAASKELAPDRLAPAAAKAWMVVGVTLNLVVLGYFKYANFFIDTVQVAFGVSLGSGEILLPIGISFYTFTQIAYLVDVYAKDVRESRFVHYGLFVTYFPHLIAGPVLHHAQMMPQFAQRDTYRFNLGHFAAGLGMFALGLLKKVVIADSVSPYADAVFSAADSGLNPTTVEAWLGSLAYTLQLYFDFSGYSDMAIGLSWMLNIKLPINFASPYKALNISDFWRRWHVTLSAFLRDYLYIALGGNRRGPVRRYSNLLVTMLLGGLWHGASWTFVLWGGLHGLYLCVHHVFRLVAANVTLPAWSRPLTSAGSWAVTMLAVVVGWVFFRATTFDGAGRILHAMVGFDVSGGVSHQNAILWNSGLHVVAGGTLCAGFGALAVLAPNSTWWFNKAKTAVLARSWLPGVLLGGAACVTVFMVTINETRDAVSAFIYFNF